MPSVIRFRKLVPHPSFPLLLKQNNRFFAFFVPCFLDLGLRHAVPSPSRQFSGTSAFEEGGNGGENFFAGDGVSWNSLSVSDTLSRSLSMAGFHKPSLTQAACIPSILSGNDTVVAAETGSGKTHGYLVPLIDQLHRARAASVAAAASGQDGGSHHHHHQIAVVLCPNVILCEQVVRMANLLCGDNGQPLLFAAVMRGTRGWPVKRPDIVVSTPYKLLDYIFAVHRERNRPFKFLRSVRYVVFDEADLLLSGSFLTQVIRLIHMFQSDEKRLSLALNSVDEDCQSSNPFSEKEENVCDVVNVEGLIGAAESHSSKGKDLNKGKYSYKRSKQYILVAATLPPKKNKGIFGILKCVFPDTNLVSGKYLHLHNPRVRHKWVEVTVHTQLDALINAVNQVPNTGELGSSTGRIRAMVFANSVEAVESVAQKLLRARIECFCFHTKCSLEEGTKCLAEFQARGGVLVCTDAVARGLDITNVSHVIQAEFATTAVDFLHRVGCTGRAGQPGLVTSLYSESDRELVAAVREAEKLGNTVGMAFNCKRSSGNKKR